MFLTTLCFIASLLGCREAETYSERRLTERIENWQVYVVAAVVQGEAGDDSQAQSLVAWTLRAWWDRARFGFEPPPQLRLVWLGAAGPAGAHHRRQRLRPATGLEPVALLRHARE